MGIGPGGSPAILAVVLLGAATGAWAQDLPPLVCAGSDPDWSIALDGDGAEVDFLKRSKLDIPDLRRAEGRDWPVAMTLIGDFDSGILIVEPATCEEGDFRALYLTQRGQSPVLLSGCCAAAR